jgi:phenylpyruvate tautomerase PptA (4-oxalocrotonate tautomerase family)
MPLYRCSVVEDSTTEAQRAHIAKEIVRIHCDITGAPASFVHAFFAQRPASELPGGVRAFVLGSIRWGRSDDQKAQIVAELGDVLADVLGCERAEVAVATVDVPSKWIMEGGELLPEPGEEAAWLERHGSA